MILYIAGPISSDRKDYLDKFNAAESYLDIYKGHKVLNPTLVRDDLPYEKYFPICFGMIDAADGIVMLRGWKNSEGAKRELAYAVLKQKKVYYGIESVPIEHPQESRFNPVSPDMAALKTKIQQTADKFVITIGEDS